MIDEKYVPIEQEALTDAQIDFLGALRSGNYKQGKGQLAKRNPQSNELEFCCLGVLADRYAKNTFSRWQWTETSTGDLLITGSMHDTAVKAVGELSAFRQLPPPVALDWVGLETLFLPSAGSGDPCIGKVDYSAASMNDSMGSTFEEIADAFEYTFKNVNRIKRMAQQNG